MNNNVARTSEVRTHQLNLERPAVMGIKCSEKEYLADEQASSIKHDYINGQVYAMAGASDKHNLITVNAASLLNVQVAEHCEVFMADMKVRVQVEEHLFFYYPDVMVCCTADDRATYYREQPCLIIEVLSDFTERVDRLEKLWSYQRLPSLQEYLLLAQDYKEATLYRRTNAWFPEVYREGEITLTSVGLTINLDDFYRRVRFVEVVT